MAEKNLIVNNLELNYKGVFNFQEFYRVLGEYAEERGYHRHEKRFEETVKPNGKEVYAELRMVKKKTEYYSLMITIRIRIKELHDITLDVGNIPGPFQEGNLNVVFDAWATTDYDHRWGMHPFYYFIKSVFHKWIYPLPLEEGFLGEVASDVQFVYRQIKSHLNLYKYRTR